MTDPETIAVDLDHLNRPTEVAWLGVLGFPLLSQAVVTIDFAMAWCLRALTENEETGSHSKSLAT